MCRRGVAVSLIVSTVWDLAVCKFFSHFETRSILICRLLLGTCPSAVFDVTLWFGFRLLWQWCFSVLGLWPACTGFICFLFCFRVKYHTHSCGLQTLFFSSWVLIFVIDGTYGMKKEENDTSVHFSIQNWWKSTPASCDTTQNATRGHTIFF
jgi:hypothetical protein